MIIVAVDAIKLRVIHMVRNIRSGRLTMLRKQPSTALYLSGCGFLRGNDAWVFSKLLRQGTHLTKIGSDRTAERIRFTSAFLSFAVKELK